MKYTNTKKLAIIAGVVLFALATTQSAIADEPSDTFDITVTGEYLWIDITNATWVIGTVGLSTSIWTNETSITFIAHIDNCTVNTDLSLQITTDGTVWKSVATGDPPASDVYRLNNSIDTWVAENETLETGDTVIASDITAGQNQSFDLRFDTPTSSTTGTLQTIELTATIVKHS